MSLAQTAIVTQFTFIASDRELSCVLKDIAAFNLADGTTGPDGANLSATFQVEYKCDNLIKIVPGDTAGYAFDDIPPQSLELLQHVRSSLRKNRVVFSEEKVLRVSSSPVAGTLFQQQAILRAACVRILASYLEEGGFQIMEVDNINKAIRILSKSPDDVLATLQKTVKCNQGCSC